MSKTDAEVRKERLSHQIAEMQGQCSIADHYLTQDPYANINYNLLQLEKAIAECRSIILIYATG